jgi:hypothetical protein
MVGEFMKHAAEVGSGVIKYEVSKILVQAFKN